MSWMFFLGYPLNQTNEEFDSKCCILFGFTKREKQSLNLSTIPEGERAGAFLRRDREPIVESVGSNSIVHSVSVHQASPLVFATSGE